MNTKITEIMTAMGAFSLLFSFGLLVERCFVVSDEAIFSIVALAFVCFFGGLGLDLAYYLGKTSRDSLQDEEDTSVVANDGAE